MSDATVRVGVGTRFLYDGEVTEVVEVFSTTAGIEVVLRSTTGHAVLRVSVRSAGFEAGAANSRQARPVS
jgi:hypothetical protein